MGDVSPDFHLALQKPSHSPYNSETKMAKNSIEHISISEVDISPWNVRRGDVQEGLEDLAKSIQEHGLLQPVVVCKREGRYKLIIGQRRFRACRDILGRQVIPARVIPIQKDADAIALSFSENIHRLDLEYSDKMTAAIALLDKLGSVKAVAQKLGVSNATVRNYLGYSAVPDELKDLVSKGKLSARTATEITRSLPDEQEAIKVAKKVVETPRGGDKRRNLIDAARENPSKTVEEIAAIALKQKYKRITIDLTSRVSAALERACEEYSSEPPQLARQALEDWLARERYLS